MYIASALLTVFCADFRWFVRYKKQHYRSFNSNCFWADDRFHVRSEKAQHHRQSYGSCKMELRLLLSTKLHMKVNSKRRTGGPSGLEGRVSN